ncbi:MAG: DUF2155 domain-containing protein [Caulobacterales bacterium]
MARARVLLALVAGGAIAVAGGLMVSAQQPTSQAPAPPDNGQSSGNVGPPGVPTIEAPPEPTPPPTITPPPPDNSDQSGQSDQSDEAASNKAAPTKPEAAAKPPEPPKPVRSPAAILQALDKVNTETIRFAAPVGQRVRYKNLVFTVKACETTGLGDPSPQASAYVIVDSQPLAIQGRAVPPAKPVFRGWMFSNSPGLHPLQHPVYDAWLITCIAAAPPA